MHRVNSGNKVSECLNDEFDKKWHDRILLLMCSEKKLYNAAIGESIFVKLDSQQRGCRL